MVMKWHGEELKVIMKSDAGRRLQRSAKVLANGIRIKLSRSQPTAKVKSGKGKGTLVGLSPSKPGEYPKKLTGHLRRNIVDETDKDKLTARVGTNVKYGKWLELGTMRMKRRPWLSKALRDFWNAMRREWSA